MSGDFEIVMVRALGTDPFHPPMRFAHLEMLRFAAPIIEKQFGPIEVLLNGVRIDWREAKTAGAA